MLEAQSSLKREAYSAGGIAFFLALAAILIALAFEHIGGLIPCPLCLMQRWAYYAAIPVLFFAMALAGEKPRLAAFLFVAVALAFLANTGLGVYHAGAEWQLWPGPDTCAGAQSLPTSAADLLKELPATQVVRCDEAAIRIGGLSLAGWNAVTSLVLFALSLKAAFATISNS